MIDQRALKIKEVENVVFDNLKEIHELMNSNFLLKKILEEFGINEVVINVKAKRILQSTINGINDNFNEDGSEKKGVE